ncbi:MAG TPA: response regulator [Planktothrix sp.]|jgi:signal transduction histidine kinase
MSTKEISILIVEDNEDDFVLTSELLAGQFALEWAQTLENGISQLSKRTFDLVLLDLGMPGSHGIATFQKVQEERSQLPAVIVLTGNDDDELAKEALQNGAQDYLVKGQVTAEILRRAVRYSIDRYAFERLLRETNSELLLLNEELKETRDLALEASRAKSQFCANMSHELRTPIAAMLGLMELVTDKVSEIDADSGSLIVLAIESGHNLLQIVNDLLNFSQLEAGYTRVDKAHFNPAAAIESVVRYLQPIANKKNITLVSEIEPEIPFVTGDEAKLKQILYNLVGNAIKFTNQGGVQVRASLGDCKDDEVTVQFAVIDSGIGISPAERHHLFEPFSQVDGSNTRRYGGTGLGLALSKSYVELLAGRIGLSSIKGKGSTFWFHIPFEVAPNSASTQVEDTDAEFSAVLSGDILVVEDNLALQTMIKRQLESIGYSPVVVGDGRTAVRAARSHKYKAILMDLQLPLMDGYQASEQIRALKDGGGHRTPIIAVTASVSDEDHQRCLNFGMDDVLTKPVLLDGLSETLAKWIGAKSDDDSPAANSRRYYK